MKCYFFGTFNPIHKGHLQIASQIKDICGFSKVIFVPAYCPPHKKNVQNALDRLNMAYLAAGRENVSDVEFKLPLPSYSYKTILELKKRDKTEKINFIMGFDSFLNIENWAHPEILKENVNFIIAPRHFEKIEIKDFEHLKNRGWNFKIVPVDFIDVSSRQIREKIAKNEDISEFVDKKVEGYIYEHRLYKREFEKEFIS